MSRLSAALSYLEKSGGLRDELFARSNLRRGNLSGTNMVVRRLKRLKLGYEVAHLEWKMRTLKRAGSFSTMATVSPKSSRSHSILFRVFRNSLVVQSNSSLFD